MRRRFIVLTLTVAACSALDCDVHESAVSTINQRIRLAQAEMERDGAARREFVYAATIQRPYVLVILPTEGVSKTSITALDVPREAKAWLASELERRSFDGHLLGVLEADSAEWQPLAEGVSADGLVYAWKQPGEQVTIEMTMAGGRALVTSLR